MHVPNVSFPPTGAAPGGEASVKLNLTNTCTRLWRRKVFQSFPSPFVCLPNSFLSLRTRQTSQIIFLYNQCVKDVRAEVSEIGELEGNVASLGPSCSFEGKGAVISVLVLVSRDPCKRQQNWTLVRHLQR